MVKRKSYSYLNELELTDWDGKRPLIVFDGVCVLCSFFAQWVLARDKKAQFVFTTAQSSLGQALYKHYNLDGQNFETNLVIVDGELYQKMFAALRVFYIVGYPWRLLSFLKFLPKGILNFLYDRIARNRYALFGKQDVCLVPSKELNKRLVGIDE